MAGNVQSGSYGQPQPAYTQGFETQVQGSVLPQAQAIAASASGERDCPHCGKRAGKGKFCIECGKPIGSAPAAPAPAAMPSLTPSLNPGMVAQQEQQAIEQVSQAAQQQVVGPMGTRKDASKPQPRYGGLEVTSRESMPSKKQSLAEAAQQMGSANPYAAAAAAQVDPRLAQGTGGIPGAGPLSQRVAMENSVNPASPYHRSTVTSLNPDVAKFGLTQPQTQGNKGVEF
jgi:hypothetical protein